MCEHPALLLLKFNLKLFLNIWFKAEILNIPTFLWTASLLRKKKKKQPEEDSRWTDHRLRVRYFILHFIQLWGGRTGPGPLLLSQINTYCSLSAAPAKPVSSITMQKRNKKNLVYMVLKRIKTIVCVNRSNEKYCILWKQHWMSWMEEEASDNTTCYNQTQRMPFV